jgi:hypothetical protein
MPVQFRPAKKGSTRLRLALIGPAGSGKTWSALAIAQGLGGKVAVIDTEHGSASLYADRFRFDVQELSSFEPERYLGAVSEAEDGGYDVVVIDSLSHAWFGPGGALEQVDQATQRSGGSSFSAWRDVTPRQRALVDGLLACKAHVIATLRAKTAYAVDTDEKGSLVPRRVGLAPVQREGIEYEFDVVGELDLEHRLAITKTRWPALTDQLIERPGADLGRSLKRWLSS